MSEPETTKKKFKQEALAFGPLAVLAVLVIAVTVLGVKLHHRNALVAATQEQLTESKADDAKTQTQLAQATTHATDLQSQLDKAKAQAADLQPQVDLAKAAAAQLQSQLDQSRAQTADLQALLDKSKAQAADLETQRSGQDSVYGHEFEASNGGARPRAASAPSPEGAPHAGHDLIGKGKRGPELHAAHQQRLPPAGEREYRRYRK
jgi:septal ring factor EnvC (AmiA/AmiB activator)